MRLMLPTLIFGLFFSTPKAETCNASEVETEIKAEDERPILLCSYYSNDEISEMADDALNGSQDKALSLYFQFRDIHDYAQALYWAQIAMENGSQLANKFYIDALIEKGDIHSLKRARYHLSNLIQGNPGDKEDLIVIANKIEEKLAALETQ